MLDRLLAAYRATGATPPFGDPRSAHGVEMEGYCWRFTEPQTRRVVVALCGVCHGSAGDWSWLVLAAQPGHLLHGTVAARATVAREGLEIRTVDGCLRATEDRLEVDLAPDAWLSVRFPDREGWPLPGLGGLGPAQAVPSLRQYWHPHVLGGRVEGEAVVGGRSLGLDGASVYAEKNWGAAFPGRWWWGQAHGFDDPAVCVAFAGGVLGRVPVTAGATSLVVRLGDHGTLRLVAPLALVRAEAGEGAWRIRARSPRHRVILEGDGNGTEPHVLGVPVPAERRVVDRSRQHLTGRMGLTVYAGRRTLLRAETSLAGLELGDSP